MLTHDYQQHDILRMRSMEECKLVDCVVLPLKSYDDFHSALRIILDSGLQLYLAQCKVYVRQMVYCEGIHNLTQFIGPLYISLNARETFCWSFTNCLQISMLFSLAPKNLFRKSQRAGISFLLEVFLGWMASCSWCHNVSICNFKGCSESGFDKPFWYLCAS